MDRTSREYRSKRESRALASFACRRSISASSCRLAGCTVSPADGRRVRRHARGNGRARSCGGALTLAGNSLTEAGNRPYEDDRFFRTTKTAAQLSVNIHESPQGGDTFRIKKSIHGIVVLVGTDLLGRPYLLKSTDYAQHSLPHPLQPRVA